jgi:hypothetical protein
MKRLDWSFLLTCLMIAIFLLAVGLLTRECLSQTDPNSLPLTSELHLGFKLWLRPSGVDSTTHFVFRPQDANLPIRVWESADLVPGSWYSTILPAGTLEWWGVKSQSWFSLVWMAQYAKRERSK